MAKIYECRTCGFITESGEQLCDSRQMEDKDVYCNMTKVNGGLCKKIKEHHAHVCASCGRVAEQSELLCNPDVPW